jgi:hypothetical protein
LRLAWAITIHKSQGLTFEKAVIDAGAAFASGQVYVALSRCTTLAGIILKSNITNAGLVNDERIVAFTKQKQASGFLTDELLQSKKTYQSSLLNDLFNFSSLAKQIGELIKLVDESTGSFNAETKSWLEVLESKIQFVTKTAERFRGELHQLFQQQILPDQNSALQQRVAAAANYFIPHFEYLLHSLTGSRAVTDSKKQALRYNEEFEELHSSLAKKLNAVNSCVNGFNVDTFHIQQNDFVVKPLGINAYAAATNINTKTESGHPDLFKELKQVRDKICERQNAPVYVIASSATLNEMAKYLPQTLDDLIKLNGFGKVKVEKYGADFLDVILSYCHRHGLRSNMDEKMPKKQPKEKKADTKEETYLLYKQGKTVTEIAAERKLTEQTISGHLAYYVQKGLIPVTELVAKEKLVLIEPVLDKLNTRSLIPIKEKLGDNISYGEIRITVAWKEFEKTKNFTPT